MRGLQPKIPVTHKPRGHVTNQNCYISTFTRLWPQKLGRILAQDKEAPPESQVTLRSLTSRVNLKMPHLLNLKGYGPET